MGVLGVGFVADCCSLVSREIFLLEISNFRYFLTLCENSEYAFCVEFSEVSMKVYDNKIVQ